MAPKTIILKGTGIRYEALANEAGITPGHLVQLLSTGKVQLNDLVNGRVPFSVAVEDDLQGNEIDTAYTSGQPVQYEYLRSGDMAYCWLADGESVSKGDQLTPKAGGLLKKLVKDSSGTVVEENVVAIAAETLDLSTSANGAANGRLQVIVV